MLGSRATPSTARSPQRFPYAARTPLRVDRLFRAASTDADWLAEGKLPPGFEAQDEAVWLIEEAATRDKLGTLLPARLLAIGATEEREGEAVVAVAESKKMATASTVLRSCGEVNAPDLDAWSVCDKRHIHTAVRLANGTVVYGLRYSTPDKDAPPLPERGRIQVLDIDGDGKIEWLVTRVGTLHERYETLWHMSISATLVRPESRMVAYVGSAAESIFDREILATTKDDDRFMSGTLRIGPEGTQSESVYFTRFAEKGWSRGEAYRTFRRLDGTVYKEEKGEPTFIIDGEPTSVLMMTGGAQPRVISTKSTGKAWEFSMSELDPKRVVAPHRGLGKLLGTQGSPDEIIIVESSVD